MYIDFDIPIPESTPKLLREDLEKMQKLYDEGKDLAFGLELDILEVSIKSAYLDGKMTKAEALQLFHRYGIMY